MPVVPFDSLPPDARVWIFAASDPLSSEATEQLLQEVDSYLTQWKAHGEPLTVGRDWRDRRFLAIGVDTSTAGASGCSIDALFRILQRLQSTLGTTLIGGARLFYRDGHGAIRSVDRSGWVALAAESAISPETTVFDTSVTSAAQYRGSFERPLKDSWHRKLVDMDSKPLSAER